MSTELFECATEVEVEIPEDASRVRRRMATYSVEALIVAQEVDRTFVIDVQFKLALQACDRAFQLSRVLSTPQGAHVHGPTGTGKSTLAQYFKWSLPPSSLFEADYGALAIRLSGRPSPGEIISAILRRLRHPFPNVTNTTHYIKRDLAIEILNLKGTKLIFVDEGQHLAKQRRVLVKDGTSTGKYTYASELLRELMDDTKVGLVILSDSTLTSLHEVDPALDGRISTSVKFEDYVDVRAWLGFLQAACKQCKSFDLTWLCDAEPAKLLLVATEGNKRQFKLLVTEAVLVAVDAGRHSLDMRTLRTAFDRLFGIDSPMTNPYAPQP
ncbi:AAA family ATPase [Caldimonas sp. KR1-144]|uniref:AAA family ATPase n=1 Tax=Caldimonas sp. KR1-144 TaxID=3400911 RepID=UPI003C0DCA34